MRRSRVPVAEKRSTEAKTKYNSSLRKTTSMGPKVTKKNFSVSMVNTRSTTENRAKEGTEGERVEPTIEIELETPDQSVDEVGKKTTESTPMPNAEEPNPKPMEFSPIDNVEDTTGNTPETVKEESQAKRTSFTERLAMMVGMKSRDAAVEETKAEKSKTFGTVSTRRTETDQNEDQKKPGPATDYRTTTDHGTTTLELSDLMAKLDQIDEKLKHSEEDRNVIRKEMRNNKHEYLDSYFHLARATEEKLPQMSDKVDTTDGERDKNIRKDVDNTNSSDRGSNKSRKTFKKPKEFKDDSDGCIDTWVEVMRLLLEQDNLNDERQAYTAILINLEGTALKCVVAKKEEEERDTADKIFEILLNRFGSGMKGHQAMMRFEKRRQRDDESIDRFLDDLESLRRRSDPEESTNRRNFSIASKFIDGVKSDDLRTMLATYYTSLKDSAPTPEEMRQKSREYMLMKPKKYSYSGNRNTQGGSQPQRSLWYKPRDDMDKRRSCANCGSADHHVADCTTYKQGMKSLGYAPDEEDMSQMEEHEFYSGLIIKISARCFFCNQEGHFRMDCPLF